MARASNHTKPAAPSSKTHIINSSVIASLLSSRDIGTAEKWKNSSILDFSKAYASKAFRVVLEYMLKTVGLFAESLPQQYVH
jgi:hypothetical protein